MRAPVSKSALITAALCLASFVQPGGASADPTLSTLHSFTGDDGVNPYAGVIFDRSGALYGTTFFGGAYGTGTVFKLTPPAMKDGAWAERVLHNFAAGADGAGPSAGLVFDEDGALYGTTEGGGPNGLGTVFKLTPPAMKGGVVWTETVLHTFTGNDGLAPSALTSLVFDEAGALYGSTQGGGVYGGGTVFKLTPPAMKGGVWTETVLHSFTGNDGADPNGDLIFDRSHALYGSTQLGGSAGHGTVFKLTPPAMKGGGVWTETVLHSFTGTNGPGDDGGDPAGGLIFDRSGALYGTTFFGGAYGSGTVFKLTPPAMKGGAWTETVLHNFMPNDVGGPAAGLIFDKHGALYGTTTEGGSSGRGTVFKLAPPTRRGSIWTERVLHNFTGNDGQHPSGRLVFDESGMLYGTTQIGGDANYGTVFKLSLSAQEGEDGDRGDAGE